MNHILFQLLCKIINYVVHNRKCSFCFFLLANESERIPENCPLTLVFRNPRGKFSSNVENQTSTLQRQDITHKDRVWDKEE